MTVDDALLRADREARADALDVDRSFIVQAPAGSGKTELLIQRYLRLLAVVDNPEEILAITFTRKAAAEMQMRVLDALQLARRGETPQQVHRQLTASAAATVLERDARLGWDLIGNSRRMRIQTIDALNGSLTRMQPLTQGGATSVSAVAEDSVLDTLYSEAATATLDWLADGGADAAAIEDVLQHVDNSTPRYIGYLARMLKTRDQWLPFVSSGIATDEEGARLRKTFESSLERVVGERLRSLRQAMPGDAAAEFLALGAYAAENLRTAGNGDSPICRVGESHAALEETRFSSPGELDEALQLFDGIAELLLTKTGGVRKQVNKNQGFPPGDQGQKRAMTELLQSLHDETDFVTRLHDARQLPRPCYTDDQWAVLLALFRVLGVAVAEFIRLCRSRGVTDHIEIAMTAGEALGSAAEPGDVALLLDYQVRHILVDEMQDTSKAQYRMLEALTGGWQPGDGRTLFCVGDPMQSIYRFRNAEVAQFLLAREQGIAALKLEPLLLRRNFRSGEHLVHWFNQVFPDVLPKRDDPGNGAVSYARAVAVDQQRDRGEYHVYPLFGGSVAAEAQQTCNVIHTTLARHPDDSVAILVRSRTQLPALLARLREAGTRYQAVDIDRLSDLPEVIDVLALTRAMAHLGDRVAWLAILRSPWVGLDWSDLHCLVRGEPRACVLELLQDRDRLDAMSTPGKNAVRRFVEILTPFLHADRSETMHRRVERAWFALGGPALMRDESAVANVYHFLDALAKLEVGGTIADVAEFTRQLEAKRVSTSVTSQLQVMTMHKAKGLQFDHVILYGLGRYPSGSRKSVLSWFDLPDAHGNEYKVVSPIGREDELENDPIHQFIERTESAKDEHENGRLLYVACTRAIKSLHLVGNVGVTKDQMDFRPPHSGSLLRLLWPALEADFSQAFEPATGHTDEDDTEALVEPPLRTLAEPWRLPVVSELPTRDQPLPPVGEGQAVDYDWVGLDARLAGTVVHRWLQLAAERGSRPVPGNARDQRARTRRWLLELGASETMLESICDRVADALDAMFNDERGRWILDGSGAAELALVGYVNGRTESILIDRVRIADDGVHWIIDYKTGSHEGGNLDGFLRAEVDRYRAQLAKYESIYRAYSGHVARCALYYPLLQRFVEVDV